MFYTYAHYTPEGRLFYIGKGKSERRAFNFYNRNKHWKNVVEKHGKPKVQVLANWDTEEEAFSHEVLLINCFRDMGYKLCNLTDGGEGSSGRKLSDEHKAQISAKCKGKPSWIKGKHHSEETRMKIRTTMTGVKKSKEHAINIGKTKIGNKYGFGKTHAIKYRYVGTNLINGETVVFIGNKQMKAAGFDPARIGDCANGNLYRKSHRGYTWVKEKLEGKSWH